MKHIKIFDSQAEFDAANVEAPYLVSVAGSVVYSGITDINDEVVVIPNNEIWYEASIKLGESTTPYAVNALYTRTLPTITSHTFENGKGVITFATDVTNIGSYAFSSCYNLTSITIPDSVTSIDYCAFSNSDGLTSVNIPNSVTNIDDYAFDYCSALISVNIPDSVTSIGDGVFRGCSGLSSIVVSSGNTNYDSRNNCNAIIRKSDNTLIAGCKNTIIPDSVTSIADNVFFYCSNLTSITIPDSVTSIGDYAFSGCSGLTSVTISDSVTSIGDYAFSDCSVLTSITIPDSVTSIGDYAFMSCNNVNIYVTSYEIADILMTKAGSGHIYVNNEYYADAMQDGGSGA